MVRPDSVRPAGGGVAFVFQGGGSLAAPQVGMLRALLQAGIVPDLVVGSSAGALNAVAFASDPSVTGLDRLERLWMSLRRRQVAAFSARNLIGAVTGRSDGLLANDGLRRMVEDSFVARSFDETTIPAYVVATELATADPVVISEGDTVSALLASSAFPGLYPPVEVDSRLLIDGGVAADVPVLQAEALGASVSYVLPAAGSDDTRSLPHGPLSLAYHALGQILEATARRDAAAARGPVHVLPVPSSRASNPVDFRGTARLIDEGYRLANDWLDDHLAGVRSAGASARFVGA
jgi:NTE family protein